jgi:hypothetical protein
MLKGSQDAMEGQVYREATLVVGWNLKAQGQAGDGKAGTPGGVDSGATSAWGHWLDVGSMVFSWRDQGF